MRVLNDSLATLGVLPISSAAIQVKGLSLAEGGERAIVWGSSNNGTGDRLLFYDLVTFELDDEYMPAGLVPLTTIDSARFFAWDVILAIAGRAANGTSQLVFIETTPMQVLKVDSVPDNLTVEEIFRDLSAMICRLEDGSILVVSTMAWSIQERIPITEGPITASSAMTRPWIFGDPDGYFVYIDYHNDVFLRFHTPEGKPIEGVALWEETSSDAVIVAMSNPPGGALLRTYVRDTNENESWVAIDEFTIDTHVSMMLRYPWAENVTLVAFEDGSLRLFEAHLWKSFDSDGVGPGPWIGTAIVLVIFALVVRRLRKGRRGRASRGPDPA